LKGRAALVMLAVLACPAAAAAQCTISTTAVNFGAYDVFAAAPRDSTGSVTYNCLLPLSVQITLTRGSSASFAPRTLTKGAETLGYNLYLNSGRSAIWGDGTGGTGIYSGTVSLFQLGTNIVVTVFGRISALQDVAGGSYTDTVTATINF
jgi:spore coat protein U domain-containing protein, fimbrial subunit CupE1/2/3/6